MVLEPTHEMVGSERSARYPNTVIGERESRYGIVFLSKQGFKVLYSHHRPWRGECPEDQYYEVREDTRKLIPEHVLLVI